MYHQHRLHTNKNRNKPISQRQNAKSMDKTRQKTKERKHEHHSQREGEIRFCGRVNVSVCGTCRELFWPNPAY